MSPNKGWVERGVCMFFKVSRHNFSVKVVNSNCFSLELVYIFTKQDFLSVYMYSCFKRSCPTRHKSARNKIFQTGNKFSP